MFTIITGGGRTGTFLAVTLLSEKHRVRLIENRRDVLARLHRELPTEAIYEGDPTDPQVLELAGIREASVLAAITTNDADNLALCYLARETYNVPRTIARVNNPRTAWLFNQTFHVDVAVNQATILASTIEEEMSLGDMMTLLKLRRGEYSIVEEKVHPSAVVVGKALRDLSLPTECVFAAIIRKGQLILPRGETVLEATDEVIALVHSTQLSRLATLLGPAH
jgi:trk system potassium uptake protein TrkA